jgi:hypothetical protein
MAMNLRRKLTREIEKQEQKILQMQADLAAAQAYLRAQQDFLKMLPRDDGVGDAAVTLRANSDLARARDAIRKSGKPLHITDILQKLNKSVTHEARSSLAGSIGWYVRRNEIFTRPAPNTFGLKEFNKSVEEEEEPPDNFGMQEEKVEK